MAHDVFISYSSMDKVIADTLCNNLEISGIRCWIAPRDIRPGELWPEAIAYAISISRVMLLIFSSNSNNSEDVANELILAVESKIIVIPYRIENIKPKGALKYYLSSKHWFDASNPPTSKQVKRLADIIITSLADYKIVISENQDSISQSISSQESKAPISISETVMLGNEDTNICIIGGDGIYSYALHRIICHLDNQRPLIVPDFLKHNIKLISIAEKEKKLKGLPYAWNGKMAHIASFNDTRTPDNEERQLEIRVQVGEYYHFMATIVALHEDFESNGFNSALRLELIGNFSDWRFSTPPNVLNGLPVNLHVITEDDNKLVFSKRSNAVAISPNQVSAAINENIHPDHDRLGRENRLDFEKFIQRSLIQELGWNDKDHSGALDDPRATTHILLFTIDTARVAYGLLGYTILPINFNQLHENFKMKCEDRFEIAKIIAIDLEAEAICRFIHENRLYNSVGLGAVFALIHRGESQHYIQSLLSQIQQGQ